MVIDELRNKIDRIDQELLELLAERFQIAREIGKEKMELNLPTNQQEREMEILSDRLESAKMLGVNADFTKELFNLLFSESKIVQEKDRDGKRV